MSVQRPRRLTDRVPRLASRRHRPAGPGWEPVWAGEESLVHVVAGRLEESGVATRIARLAGEPRGAFGIQAGRAGILVRADRAAGVREILRERGEAGVVEEEGDVVRQNARALLRVLPFVVLAVVLLAVWSLVAR